MEQVGSGARQKRKDANPFYVNITVIRNCNFTWKDDERCMPTQSEVAQIRKSSVPGQYKKQVEFYRNMSEKMVKEKLEETFPYLRNKSYACKVFTSRPAGCISTSRIWDGKTIKKNTQGNSALYILEDEAEAEVMETSQQSCSNETATEGLKLRSADPLLCHGSSLPDSPPPDTIKSSLFQNTTLAPRPRAMRTSENSEMPQESPHETNDSTNSYHQVPPVALYSLNQPTSSNTSATVIVQNTLQPPNDYPMQEGNILNWPSAASTNCNLINTQDMADAVTFQQLNQLTCTLNDTSATVITQHNMQPCSDFQVRESRIPPGPSVASTSFSVKKTKKIAASVALSSLNQLTLSDTSATIMVQNTLQAPNDNPIQDFSLFPGPSAAMVDMAKPQNFTAADDDSNQETKVEQLWKGMTDSGNSQMADDNDHTVASLNINQPTSSESSPAFMDQNNMYPWNDSPMLDFIALLDIEMSDSLADNHSTTSGISGLDHNSSLDDLSPHEDEHFDFSVTPKKVPLQGAEFCRFSSTRALPGNVQSAVAVFEPNLGTVEVGRCGEKFLDGERIPPSNKPGKVKISLRAGNRELGEAEIFYYHKGKEAVEQIIEDAESLEYFFRKYSEMLSNRNNTTASGADVQNSGICGEWCVTEYF